MATHHGKDGVVKIGANAVAEVTEFDLNIQADRADDTAMGDAWKTHLVGLKSWSGNVKCHWDETDTNGQVAMTEGASVSLALYPEGADSGDSYFSGTATISSVQVSASRDGVVSASFAFEGNGALTRATVA